MSRAFLDSNILVYAFTDGDLRQPVALALLQAGGAISVQCLNEFASVMTRKLKLADAVVNEAIEIVTQLSGPILPITLDLHHAGMAIAQRYRLSVYDAMIVAAALTAECDVLYSEDMHHGLIVDGRLRIVNRFLADDPVT